MQKSKASSSQVSIWDQEEGSLLSALAGFAVVSFHVLVITFNFSFLWYYLILTEDKRRWSNGKGK